MSLKTFLSLFCLSFIVWGNVSVSADAAALCDDATTMAQPDCETLTGLFDAWGGTAWTTQTGWLADSDPCSWHGVTCFGDRVGVLALNGNNLAGEIPAAIGNLTLLTRLDLGGNRLSGEMPPEIGQLSNLHTLYLNSNQLQGSIPSAIGNTQLSQLALQDNQLTGSLPAALGDLPLTNVQLENNQLMGDIPAALFVPTLNLLYLHDNQLSGTLPRTISNTLLTQLYLSNNRLSGTLPAELGHVTTLTTLSLGNNLFTGELPDTLSQLTLDVCEFNFNQFEYDPQFLQSFVEQCGGADNQTVPPRNVRVEPIPNSDTSLRLQWEPISYTGETVSGTYQININAVFADDTRQINITDRTITSTTITGLIPREPYTISIQSITPNHQFQPDTLISRPAMVGGATDIDLLSIFALSMDSDLDKYYDQVQAAAITATIESPNKVALILADRKGADNTHVLLVHNGRADLIAGQKSATEIAPLGLPDWAGEPNGNLIEYDMASGETLGGFLLWAPSFFNATRTTFTFVGHGTAVAPDVEGLFALFDSEPTATPPSDNPFPLPGNQFANPGNQFANPDYTTDTHFPLPGNQFANPGNQFANPDGVTDGAKLITPHALAQALSIATNNGQNKLAVLDLVHCFAGTIEELYELHPYTEAIVSSPNYAYFGDDMIRAAIQAPTPGLSAPQLAETIVNTYETALAQADNLDGDPDVQHPRIITAVNSNQIEVVKTAVVALSDQLLDGMIADPAATKSLITAAHQNSGKYDTTLCNSDPSSYALNEQDALSDLYQFADQIKLNASGALVGQADDVMTAVDSMIITTTSASGRAWFMGADAPEWEFDGRGIGIYTDFGGFSDEGTTYLGWQTHWYNDGDGVDDNDNPLSFLEGNSWDELLAHYWEGESIQTVACIPVIRGLSSDPLALVEPLPPPVSIKYTTLNHISNSDNRYTVTLLLVACSVLLVLSSTICLPIGFHSMKSCCVNCTKDLWDMYG